MQVVIYCDVFTGNVGLYSDGVLVNPSTGASCSAYNSVGGQGVIVSLYLYNTNYYIIIKSCCLLLFAFPLTDMFFPKLFSKDKDCKFNKALNGNASSTTALQLVQLKCELIVRSGNYVQ